MEADKAKDSSGPIASSRADERTSGFGPDLSSLSFWTHALTVKTDMPESATKVNFISTMNKDSQKFDTSVGSENHPSALRADAVSRRRLLKTGAAVSPVILTLISKPVLAGYCPTGSVLASLNVSGHTHQGVPCSGRSPGYWKNHESEWPTPYVPTTSLDTVEGKKTRFNQVFTQPLSTDKTLFASLENSAGGGENAVRSHIVASLLNAASGYNTTFLSVTQVQMIWNNYKLSGGGSTGYWQPGSGVVLYADETKINGVTLAFGKPGSGGITGWLKENMS